MILYMIEERIFRLVLLKEKTVKKIFLDISQILKVFQLFSAKKNTVYDLKEF